MPPRSATSAWNFDHATEKLEAASSWFVLNLSLSFSAILAPSENRVDHVPQTVQTGAIDRELAMCAEQVIWCSCCTRESNLRQTVAEAERHA